MEFKLAHSARQALASAVLLAMALLCPSSAQGKTDVPPGGQPLLGPDPLGSVGFWAGNNDGSPVGSYRIVEVDHPDFDQAIRVEVERPTGQFFNGAVIFGVDDAVASGDVLLIRIFFRSIETTDESGASFATVFAQGPPTDYTKYLTREITAFGEWKEFLFPFEMTEALPAGQLDLQIGFGAGSKTQTFEIGGIELINYQQTLEVGDLPQTRPSYVGREPDAAWRSAAQARIEAHRKGDFRLRVLDATGSPIPEAAVDVDFLKHHYHFGSVIAAHRLLGEGSDSEIYRQKVVELFNQSGPENDLKWGPWDGEWGANYSREQTLEALAWLRDRGLYVRGHVMVWPSKRNLPNSIQGLLPEGNPEAADPAAKQAVLNHIDDVGSATAPLVDEWDVLNEPFDNHYLMDAFGDQVMVDWFVRARENLPTQGLYLNDYSILSGGGRNAEHQQHYEDTLRFLVENGAPITGMGMQGHFSSSPTSIPLVYNILERYANAFPDLDIRITEFDVNTSDEEMQADYTRDFMTMVFSHPRTVGIQSWGFWEGQIWLEDTAMFRLDWSKKPNAIAYENLVFKEWWNDFRGTTGVSGQFERRGFYGSYRATVSLAGEETEFSFQLEPDGESDFVIHLEDYQLPAAPLVNGSFETGDLQGWTAESTPGLAHPPAAMASGQDLPLFPIEPSSGNYALGMGLGDGELGSLGLSQTIQVPDLAHLALSFRYRLAWSSSGVRDAAPLVVEILDEEGQPLDAPFHLLGQGGSSDALDTGHLAWSTSLEAWRGQSIQLTLRMDRAEGDVQGQAFAQIDLVEIQQLVPPELSIAIDPHGSARLSLRRTGQSPARLERSSDLQQWATAAELPAGPEGEPTEWSEALDAQPGNSIFYRIVE